MSTQSLAPARKDLLRSVRRQTLQLFDFATSEQVLRSEPMTGFRPLLWHLAHIGVYQNYWILQRCAGQSSINPAYDVHFDPIRTPREEAKVLPARVEIEAYLNTTLRLVEEFLAGADMQRPSGDAGLLPSYALDLVLEHEMQHQETIAFVLQSMPYGSKKDGPALRDGKRATPPSEIHIPAMRAEIGAADDGFAYDNERSRHPVELASFYIDRDLTTNQEYAEFIAAGGYSKQEWWSADGWAWRESNGIDAPLYWSDGPSWKERGFLNQTALRADAPVSSISCYEAEAYAAFRGKRLPSEEEWEVAASWDPAARIMRRFPWGDDPSNESSDGDARALWGTTPVGSLKQHESQLGLHDVIGNVWQWTSSEFRGYAGFEAFPYPEYSELWFDGDHRVSRGGSWFTSPALARTSFRNFYRRQFRPAFIGVRCARDAR